MRLTQLTARIAAVLICGGLCGSALASVYSQRLTQPGDFSGGIFERTEISDSIGGVTLNRSLNCVPFLWVPGRGEGIVSKIDARSGAELARYRTGPSGSDSAPCAVAIDYDGNAYVACGGPGVGRIVKIQASGAGRSVVQTPELTSADARGIGKAEALPWGRDTRVSVVAELGLRSRPSSLAFGANGLLWVGLWGEQSMVAVDIGKQTVVHTVVLPGNPDAVIAGPSGSLWVLCGEIDTLCRIDTLLGTISRTLEVAGHGLKSMCAGDGDTIWLGSEDGLVCLNAATGDFTIAPEKDGAALAGVATDKLGDVWAACPSKNLLVRFSGIDQSIRAAIEVGRGPNSVGVDEDGYVWSLNEETATASRVDPRTTKCVALVATGRSPFSSTPFTANVLKRGVCPSGGWSRLFDSNIPGAGWGSLAWLESSAGGHLRVEARSADVPTALDAQEFTPVSNGIDFAVPNGRYLEVKVAFEGGNNTSPILREMMVQGRNLPPDVSRAAPTTDRIARLDHSFETVAISGVTDPEGDPVAITVTGVAQDEPVWGLGPKDKFPDALGVGKSEVRLRAECDAGTVDEPGNGRTYTVTFKATDPLGASTTGTVKVLVPPVLRWDAIAIEDQKKFDSTKQPETSLMAKA